MLGLALSMTALVLDRQQMSINTIRATHAYYAAEGGAEDALIKIKRNPLFYGSCDYNIDGSTAYVSVSETMGGEKVITSTGNNSGSIKKVRVGLNMSDDEISFHYGVLVGEGGLEMGNGSQILGNVFSNGNVTGGGVIEDDVIISGTHIADGIDVHGDLFTWRCLDSHIVGNLTYVSSWHGCTYQGIKTTVPVPFAPEPLPISEDKINEWKEEASENIIDESVLIDGGSTTLGPVRINGSLTIGNKAVVTLTGTVHVTGPIIISTGATVRLSSSYGSLDGILLSDGQITVLNNGNIFGSGQPGSYVLVLSTSPGLAISIANNTAGGVFYASAGTIYIANNATVKEVIGYKITLGNNAIVSYDSGMVNMNFSNGPSGGWDIGDWVEE